MAARKRWIQCRDTGKLIPEEEFHREKVVTHSVIEDTMAPTWHPAADVICESKSDFRRLTKSHNCVEVGTGYKVGQKREVKKAPGAKRDLERAYSNLNG